MIDIPGFEGLYAVTDDGKVWIHDKHLQNGSLHGFVRKGKWAKPTTDRDGYESVWLSKDGNRRGFKVHRLVAQSYIPNPLNLPEINHKNKVRNDNIADNLEWVSRQQNVSHQFLGYTRPKVTCPHCGKQGANNVMSRFHFDHCPSR